MTKRNHKTAGENNGRAKLDLQAVKIIRHLLACGHTGRDIAKVYAVTGGLVSLIKHGKAWSAPEEKLLDKWR